MNKTYLFIAISSFALIIVLVIQVNWILKSAKIKEELFSEKANMVLSKTTAALYADTETCRKIEDSSENDPIAILGEEVVQKIDSLFTHYMNFYNLHIGYSFVVTRPTMFTATNIMGFDMGFDNNDYDSLLEELGNGNRIELKRVYFKVSEGKANLLKKIN
ncbi:MAG: hypothetical protein GY810_12335, partial [Aureispira sp.]|nr:hypothetical protein [Aureispira sp.]